MKSVVIFLLCAAALGRNATAARPENAGVDWTQFSSINSDFNSPGEQRFARFPSTTMDGEMAGNPLDENNGLWFQWSGSLAIPDVQCPALVNAPITVSATGVAVDVEVIIYSLTHTYDGDLNIYLRGPTGIQVPLCLRRGGSGDNFVNTLFDDQAETPIGSGTAPFSNEYIPEVPLSTFYGSSVTGTWQLQICDAAGQDVGALTGWGLQLLIADCTPQPWNDVCWNVTPVSLPATFSGNTDCATADCPVMSDYRNVWIAFYVAEACDVVLRYCNSSNLYRNAWLNLVTSCSCGGITSSAQYDYVSCPSGQLTMRWNDLPAGTYYYPVMLDPVNGSSGPYSIEVSCEVLGRCCYGDPEFPSCQLINATECAALSGNWRGGFYCTTTPCSPAAACPPYAHISQPPYSPTAGWVFYTSDTGLGYEVYDYIPGPVIEKHLRFWGWAADHEGGWNGCFESPMQFTVMLRHDSSGFPGAPFCTTWPTITPVPGDWYTGTDENDRILQFDMEFGGACAGSGVWLSIQGREGVPECVFLWCNSPTGSGMAMQRNSAGELYNLNTSMAFCISGAGCVPEASTCPGKTIPSLPFGELGDTRCAENDIEQCAYPGFTTAYNVYAYSSPTCQRITANMCYSPFDTELEVRTGGPCPGTTRVACNDDNPACGGFGLQSYLTFIATSGQTYYFILGGYGGQAGAYRFLVDGTPYISPNDQCPGTSITTLPFLEMGDTRCAADNYSWSCPSGGVQSSDVVYTLTLPTCQQVTASLCGSGYDTGLEVRTGGSCPGTVTVACNDDNFCDGEFVVQSELTFTAQAGITYFLLVDGWNGQRGPYYLGVIGVPCEEIGPPSELVVSRVQTTQDIRLNWSPAAGVTLYNVYRGLTPGFVPDAASLIAQVTDTTYVDMNVLSNPQGMHFYVVTSVNSLLVQTTELSDKKFAGPGTMSPELELLWSSSEEYADASKRSQQVK